MTVLEVLYEVWYWLWPTPGEGRRRDTYTVGRRRSRFDSRRWQTFLLWASVLFLVVGLAFVVYLVVDAAAVL